MMFAHGEHLNVTNDHHLIVIRRVTQQGLIKPLQLDDQFSPSHRDLRETPRCSERLTTSDATNTLNVNKIQYNTCLLYTSDAADE